MTPKQLVEKVAELGLDWTFSPSEAIRCADGNCPIVAYVLNYLSTEEVEKLINKICPEMTSQNLNGYPHTVAKHIGLIGDGNTTFTNIEAAQYVVHAADREFSESPKVRDFREFMIEQLKVTRQEEV